MRIIHVVSLFTPDGAFGGPTRVAINQTRELRARGHDVTLAGGAMGYGKDLPSMVDGVPVTLFPAYRLIPRTGFAGLASPGLLAWFRRAAKTADVVHIHLARDLLTLPVAIYRLSSQQPYVLQTHGMVDAPSNILASVLDRAATLRILRGARMVLCLSLAEVQDVDALGDGIATAVLPNGVPLAEILPSPQENEVLFLSRMHHRKRPTAFVEAAASLSSKFPKAQFSMVGPDEGQAEVVSQRISVLQLASIRWEGALPPERTLQRLRRCSIYVLPSINEPFPMTAIEAMSVGKPVVLTDTCALAPLVESTNSGIVVDSSVKSLTKAIQRLLEEPSTRDIMGANAHRLVRDQLGIAPVADRLESMYYETIGASAAATAATAATAIFAQPARRNSRASVVLASAGRRAALANIISDLSRQAGDIAEIVISTPTVDDAPSREELPSSVAQKVIYVHGSKGLPTQRNRALNALTEPTFIAFFDDDCRIHDGYLRTAMDFLGNQGDAVGITGGLLIDGAAEDREISNNEALDLLREQSPGVAGPQRVTALYGCNFVVRAASAAGVSFDDHLPLYGWLEDLDYSRRLAARGELWLVPAARAVHLGASSGGRIAHERFGYSQLANPMYLRRKKVISRRELAVFLVKGLPNNLLFSVRGKSREMRRQRLAGNLIAVRHWVSGSLDPRQILNFDGSVT